MLSVHAHGDTTSTLMVSALIAAVTMVSTGMETTPVHAHAQIPSNGIHPMMSVRTDVMKSMENTGTEMIAYVTMVVRMDIGPKNGMVMHALPNATSVLVNTGTQIMDVNAIMKHIPGMVLLTNVDATVMNTWTGIQ
jgi:hypothetical protein